MAVGATGPVTSPTTTSGTTTAQKKASINYDNFLQLLVAQLKNQDPTEPMDASQQMSQLATFSQVEQTIQTNTKLDSILTNNNLTQAGDYIGKYMTSADGETKGTVESVKVYSDGMIATTTDGKSILVQTGIKLSDSPKPSGS